jgi:hypothetical protein
LEITICGHRRAVQILKEKPKELDILMISSPEPYGSFFGVEGSEQIPELARECKMIAFHDIDFPRPGYHPPSKEDIQEALKWAKGKKKIIVACQAGISRSSATAYVIKCTTTDPRSALLILDEDKHSPNMMIIRHGADILQKPEMVDIVLDWKYRSEESRNAWNLDDTDQIVS